MAVMPPPSETNASATGFTQGIVPISCLSASILLFCLSCSYSQCLASPECREGWEESTEPCSEEEGISCESNTSCGSTIYCRPLVECQAGNPGVEWIPRLPIEYDCGPGCEQIIDEQPDAQPGWDVRGRYLCYSPGYEEGARVIDLETHCFLRIYHPEFTNWLTKFRSPSIDGE
jgi:hypothetical protein